MNKISAEPYPDLSALSTQLDVDTTPTGDADNVNIFEIQKGTEDDDGANNSFWMFTFNQHAFGASLLTA